MACEFLDGGRVTRCRAVLGVLIPSHHERERYCHGDSDRCPTLRLYRIQSTAIPQQDYYALWVPVRAPRADEERAVEPAVERTIM